MAVHTLLLRLAGPMQSWGTQSRYTERDTGREPSKSGVVGLLAAARGLRRTDDVDELAALRLTIRVDREGAVRRDYQTALDVPTADGSQLRTVPSNRFYLADADFLVAVSGDDLPLLEALDAALAAPTWPLCLGRAAFVPGVPIRLRNGGLRPDQDGIAALKTEAWHPRRTDPPHAWPMYLRAAIEMAPEPGTERRVDQPGQGAAFAHRRFLPRYVKTKFWPLGDGPDAVPIGEVWDV